VTTTPIQPVSECLQLTSGPEDLAAIPADAKLRMLFEMLVINHFENAVMNLKEDDCIWGPIHLAIGQEATAAAVMNAIGRTDRITGSHRAHHITVAKLLEYFLPDGWNPAKDEVPVVAQDAVFQALAEIMGLSAGICGGRGGSMHLRHREAGVLGTNAIVAGGVPLSVGAALGCRRTGSNDLIVAFMGDGAVNQGAFHEACNLASLWKLPVIFVVENNQYAVATSVHDASAADEIAHVASAYSMPARQVYGYDVAAMHAAITDAAAAMRGGAGPWLVEVKCYRFMHHGGALRGSQFGYRDKAEEDDWQKRDALATYPAALVQSGDLSKEEVESIRRRAEELVAQAVARATTSDDPPRPRPELIPSMDSVSDGVRSDGEELEGLPYAVPGDFTGTVQMKYSDSIAAVTGRWLEKDETVVVMGEEVANFGGGAYGATKGLPAKYPDRVLNTPISEGGFSGLGLGAAMSGLKPVVEIMFPDFTLVAADQIFNQIGKARHMYGGSTELPIVLRIRIATGCGYGGQHSMDPSGLYAMFPGWRIVAPRNSFDYVGLFNSAMHSLDPVVILEHHSLYTASFPVPEGELDYCIPFGRAEVVRQGTDLTAVGYGAMTERIAAAAESLAGEVDVEVIDLKTLDYESVDFDLIGRSLAKTGAFAVFEQAAESQGIGRRLAAEVTERFFDELDAPPGAFASLDVPAPVSRWLEEAALLGDEEIAVLLRDTAKRAWK
jgi:2-oxoisovalerate dehydrogenase E1 component